MARILFVDDDDGFRSALSEMLALEGHEVVQARDGSEGIQAFLAAKAELVITDLMMPKKDGVMLIQEILHEFPNTKIIAISGGPAGAPAWLPFAKSQGALKVLKKPFSREKLLEAVSEVLGTSA